MSNFPHVKNSCMESVSMLKSNSYLRGSSSVVERQLPKLNVAGSNPVSRSKKLFTVFR